MGKLGALISVRQPQKGSRLACQEMELTLKGLLDACDGRQLIRHCVVQQQPHIVSTLVVRSPEQPKGACTCSNLLRSHETVLVCKARQRSLEQQHGIAAGLVGCMTEPIGHSISSSLICLNSERNPVLQSVSERMTSFKDLAVARGSNDGTDNVPCAV